jgi:hypothetical protein
MINIEFKKHLGKSTTTFSLIA